VLNVEQVGKGNRVVLVHGFTQSARSWGEIATALAARHTVVAVDAPGHGRSSRVSAGLDTGADLMVEATGGTAGGPAAWIGYSMGGRYALHVALRHPGAVDRLVLVSATAGIDDPADRAERQRSDEALATRIEAEGVESFLRFWLEQPLFSTLPAGAAGLETRLGSTPAGLASSLRLAGAGRQQPLWNRLTELNMPVLVVTGELDSKYSVLGDRLARTIGPGARHEVLARAGHACHLERPEAFLAVVTPFLDAPKGGTAPRSDPDPDGEQHAEHQL
jgi:2-succinyl-6-hydroxy-2,4-cyclohexadiene-1-carboxylate synthase